MPWPRSFGPPGILNDKLLSRKLSDRLIHTACLLNAKLCWPIDGCTLENWVHFIPDRNRGRRMTFSTGTQNASVCYASSFCLSVFRCPALLGYCLFWQPATFIFCCLLEIALASKDWL